MFRLHCSPELPDPSPDAACLKRLATVARRTLSCHAVGGLINVVLTSDDEVRRLNRTFRARDKTTDVLSFSLNEDEQPPVLDDEDLAADTPMGEIYISVEQARLQAEELGVPHDEELSRLLVHGLLHLAGFDHQTEAELHTMEGLTEELLGAAPADTITPSWRTGLPKGV